MQQPKPRAPVYPRPVSPLCVEPAFTRPDDVVYESDSSAEDGETQAAKRRKIEKLAEQYRRGDGLYIMTASLKGPLNAWKNPWIKRRKPRNSVDAVMTGKELEVPETAAGKAAHPNVNPAALPLQHDFRSPKIPEPTRSDSPIASTRVQLLDAVSNNHKPLGDLAGNRNPQSRDQTTTSKVEDWLKRHDACENTSIDHPQSSPTPVHQRPMTPEPRLEKEHANISTGLFAKPKPPSHPPSRFINLAGDQDQLHDVEPVPQAYPMASTNLSDKPKSSHRENADRAEFALLQSRQRSLHTAPSSTHMSPFEYRRALDGNLRGMEKTNSRPPAPSKAVQSMPDELKTVHTTVLEGDAQTNPASAPGRVDDLVRPGSSTRVSATATQMNPPELRTMNSNSVPNLSTETSRTSVTNVLPSAQVEVVQVPQLSTSETSNIDRMLDEPQIALLDTHETTEYDAASAATSPKPVGGIGPLQSKVPEKPLASPKRRSMAWGIPVNATPDAESSSKNLDTQQMLQAITPLSFSTVKKVTRKKISKNPPVTTARSKAKKHSKATALAVDTFSSNSSHGSLKESLKVAKAHCSPTDRSKAYDGPSPFGKIGLDMETSMEDNSPSHDVHDSSEKLPNVSSLLRNSPSPMPYKSALKLSAPMTSTLAVASTKDSTSTAMQQDAQKIERFDLEDGQHQKGAGKEDFNLDAAIDDLGSYLGTWDAEKEATSLMSGCG